MHRVCARLRLLLGLSLLLAARYAAAQNAPDASGLTPPAVHVVYVVPADRYFQRDYAVALQRAIENLRAWYLLQLGKTFTLPKSIEVVYSDHRAQWYANTSTGGDASLWFWYNAIADGFALTGGRFGDPNARWLYYVDADPDCGQRTGATAGVALFPGNDLRGLAGDSYVTPCPTEPRYTNGSCRWIGAMGHELGHALGLFHPLPCPGGSGDTALMCLGYLTYPDTYFLPQDKATLSVSPFLLSDNTNLAAARHFGCRQR